MSKHFKNYEEYWAEISRNLDAHIKKNVSKNAIEYIERSLALFSYTTENLKEKATKNTDRLNKMATLLVETQDIIRGVLVLYQSLTLAPIALISRTAFEIHCTLRFISSRSDLNLYIDRFYRFSEIEKLKGLRTSSHLKPLSKEEEQRIIDNNSDWKDSATGKLVKRPHWSVDCQSLEEIAKQCGLEKDYDTIYRVNSKFTHASPLLKNMYGSPIGIGAIPKGSLSTSMALTAVHYCMGTLILFCEMYGIEFDGTEYDKIQKIFLLCQPEIKAMQKIENGDFQLKK